jgi:hypothetical protein
MKLEFSRHIFEKYLSNLMKIRPLGAELYLADRQIGKQTDRQTYMTKLIVAFLNFGKAPKMSGAVRKLSEIEVIPVPN